MCAENPINIILIIQSFGSLILVLLCHIIVYIMTSIQNAHTELVNPILSLAYTNTIYIT